MPIPLPHGQPIPEAPCANFQAKEIVHARLTLKWPLIDPANPLAPQDLTFAMDRVENRADPGEIESYAKGVATAQAAAPPPVRSGPWDVGVTSQCYLLFELDRVVRNWRFIGPGLDSKGAGNGSYDFGMRWFDSTGGSHPATEEIETRHACRVLYLAVGERRYPGTHGVNIWVEFDHGSGLKLPVIFDPDIPNDGPDAIPP